MRTDNDTLQGRIHPRSLFREKIKKLITDNKIDNSHFLSRSDYIKKYIVRVISENSTVTGGYVEYVILSTINKEKIDSDKYKEIKQSSIT